MDSQNNKILTHLQSGKPITTYQAFTKYNCTRLSARIKDLRDKGYNITTRSITRKGKTFAEYRLEK